MASTLSLCLLALGIAAQDGSWTETGTYPFDPAKDEFRADALLDLRSLNEKVAGESGFVKLDDKGDFLLGNDKPFRMWAVNSFTAREKTFTARPLGRQTAPDLDRHARFLAKRGVNMVRYHGQIAPKADNPAHKLTDVDQAEVDWAWRMVASMKKQGIYVTLSPYWGVPFKVRADWGITGGAHENALALLYFEPKLKAAYKEWLRKLLTPPNPYTGIPLAKDPALAIIQLQNEDSLFFWTVNNVKGEAKVLFGKEYGKWLLKKHGSRAGIQKAWQSFSIPEDKPDQGYYELMNIWEMTQERTGGQAARLEDQTQFWAELQKGFNQEMADFLRNDLGCKQLTNATNWKTANTVRLMDIERWTYTANEVDAVNGYFTGIHKGPHEGWAIQNGDFFTNPSALRRPEELPINLKQTARRPIMVTESSWVYPMAYASEGPFLIAAYQGLTGVDAFFWFATGDDEWTRPESANGYNPSQGKWIFGNPDMLGGFPAAALMHRMGAVKRGAPVVEEVRALPDLWSRRTPIIAEESTFDPNRDAGSIAPRSGVKAGIAPSAFLVGPVTVQFGGDPSQTRASDFAPFIDKASGVIRSNTRELALNHQLGWCTVDTPMAQGVSAFFAAKPAHRLTDVTFLGRNEYGTALAVSMDGKPLKDSGKVLVQYVTRSRPTGWQDKAATRDIEGAGSVRGREVVSYGQAPWRVVEANLEVEIANPGLRKATELDPNGNPLRPVPLTKAGPRQKFTFPARSLYVVLEK